MEKVFKALADPTRRKLLDALRKRDGQTLTELEERFDMTRFGVMKHLRLLEDAGLVVTHKVGREKLHYLNPVPIRSIQDRWISKYAAPWAASLTNLKQLLEENMETKPSHLFRIYIRTTPEILWRAITTPEETKRYFFNSSVQSDWKVGSPVAYIGASGTHDLDGRILEIDPPRKLVMTFEMTHDPEASKDRPSRVTWEIEEQGSICLLTVLHDDFDGETATYRGVSGGWPYIISNLKSVLETGESLPQPKGM